MYTLINSLKTTHKEVNIRREISSIISAQIEVIMCVMFQLPHTIALARRIGSLLYHFHRRILTSYTASFSPDFPGLMMPNVFPAFSARKSFLSTNKRYLPCSDCPAPLPHRLHPLLRPDQASPSPLPQCFPSTGTQEHPSTTVHFLLSSHYEPCQVLSCVYFAAITLASLRLRRRHAKGLKAAQVSCDFETTGLQVAT